MTTGQSLPGSEFEPECVLYGSLGDVIFRGVWVEVSSRLMFWAAFVVLLRA